MTNADELIQQWENRSQRYLYDALLNHIVDEVDRHCPDGDMAEMHHSIERLRRDFGPKEN